MTKRMSSFGIVLTLAALAALSFSAPAFAAGGNGSGNNTGGIGNGGFSAGGFSGGHTSGGFGSGAIGNSGFNAGRMSGGFSSSPFAHSTTSGSSHSSSIFPSFTPNSSAHFSPSFSSGSHSSFMPNSFSHTSINSSTWQHSLSHWNNGQWWHDHWHWWGNGGFSPAFVFIPFFYGYGYYPQFFYGYDPYSFYALYPNVDPGLPPVNVVAANPFVVGADVNAANPNGANPFGAAPAANQAAPNPPVPNPPLPDAGNNPVNNAADGAEGDPAAGAQFFAQAEAAFQDGRYHDATRLATHAAVESPRNPKAHELMSLSMFAAGDWRGAAIEAHAAIALGPIADWATLFGYYGDQTKYTNQLRALEKYSHENPKAADARFLRAYHYLMSGHTDAAKEQLAEAVKLTPNDKLAAELLKKYSGNAAPGANAGAAVPPQPIPPPAAPVAPQNPAAGQQPANPLPPGTDS